MAAVAAFPFNETFADDLNPPSYRGGPLSVHAHWQNIPGTPLLELTAFTPVDDSDPTTILHSLLPTDPAEPNPNKDYQFDLPNFIDDLPIKYMRIQLTWEFIPDPPLLVGLSGIDGTSTVLATIVSSSPVTTIPTPTGDLFYQYHDIEFTPNPDAERWVVDLLDNANLVQVVVDTISTVPEPATLTLLGLGSFVLLRKRT